MLVCDIQRPRTVMFGCCTKEANEPLKQYRPLKDTIDAKTLSSVFLCLALR